MGLRRLLIFIAISIGNIPIAISQCPTVDFSLPANACSFENIQIENASQPGTLTWDFCAGDFSNTPSAQTDFTLSAAVGRPAMEFAKDGNRWFAFVTGTWTSNLYRLEFENGISNAPTFVQNLGNIGGKLNEPGSIRIINSNGNWFGLVHNTATGELLRISFGNSLSNAVQGTTSLITGIGSVNNGMAVAYDEVDGWVCIISTSSNQFKVLRLGSTLSAPSPTDILTTTSVPNPSVLGDIDLIKQCDQWFGYANNLGNGNVYRLSFGSSLFQQPTIAQVTNLGGINGGRLRAMQEGDEYFLAVTSLGGSFFKIDLGDDLSVLSPVIEDEGNFSSVLQNSYGLAVVKDSSFWNISVVDQGSGKVSTVKYSQPCLVNELGNDLEEPIINYPQSGNYIVSLTLTNPAGISSSTTESILVSSLIAPDIEISSENICVNHDVIFTSQNISGDIASYSWDFGDTTTSLQQNPTHQYTAAGEYQIELEVTAASGCKNLAQHSLITYNEPVADFLIPAVNPICTNQDYTFNNTSTFDPDYSPAWQWKVNGFDVSSDEDLNFTFTSISNQDISLTASIPGCDSEIIKSISTLQEGPAVDFLSAGKCEDETITFTNTTGGSATNYVWDFGDGQQSTDENPTHQFSDKGIYDVTLTASANGCNNSRTKADTIYTKPQVYFGAAGPPFSCNGTPTVFRDSTELPTDSNLSSWLWNFGDPSSAQNSSASQNPLHTYALADIYNVTLTVSTNFNCITTLQLPIEISQTPSAALALTAPCEDVAVNFSGTSPDNIESWSWMIGSTHYSSQNPTHIFVNSGTFNAQLLVTSDGCEATADSVIVVPQKLTPNFDFTKNCTNQQTLFTDITNDGADAISNYLWEVTGSSPVSGSPAIFTFPTTGTRSVKLTVTTETGCSYPVTKPVSIVTSPTANFTASPESGGPPLLVQFTNASTNATSYRWAFNDGSGAESTVVSPSYTYQTLGQHVAELTASNALNCVHTFGKTINVVTPVFNVELNGLELVEFQNGSLKPAVTIFNHGNTSISNVSLLLNMSGPVIREHVNTTILPNNSYRHVFQFDFPSSNALDYFCVQTEMDDITPSDNTVCLNVDQSFTTIPPYPNPNNTGTLNVKWILDNDGLVDITLINSMGQSIQHFEISAFEGFGTFDLSTLGLGSGVYFLQVNHKKNSRVYRVFISE